MEDQLSSLGSLGLGGPSPSSQSASFRFSGNPEPFQAASPQLVYQSSTTAIYRLYETGFKVILDPNQTEAILQLQHELNISKFLPPSCHKRQVTDVTSFNERPALSFKWASGSTLKEWLQNAQNMNLNVRIRVAMAISKALSGFHEGGVACNRLTPENIVLAPFDFEEGECYAATLIDLSGALIYSNPDATEMDLKSLGMVLDQLFRGEEGDNAGNVGGDVPENTVASYLEPHSIRPKRGKQQILTGVMGKLPLYLVSLLSALLDPSPDHRYESAKDVFRDLKILAENKDGTLLKSELDDSTVKSRLNLQGGMFFGRQVQMSMLLHLFQSSIAVGTRPLMATISGYPGTGKSALVNQIKKPLKNLNGCFIEGKFDKAARPDSVFAGALNKFFGNIMETNTASTMSMKWRIHDAIDSGSNNILLNTLPNLREWLSDGNGPPADLASSSNNVKGIGSSHRLKFLFCKLIGAIACKAQPLILFLDDLQWADEMTLDIIRMIMVDPDIRHFLFLGCYRCNEVKLSHPLQVKLDAIQKEGTGIVPIKIGPIEKESVNELLSKVLCLPPSLSRPLSTVIHNKTGGIILFILRFLASLNNDGDIWFSMSHRRWMFDLEKIRLKEIHGDVVSHMTEQMKHLSKKMRMGLMVAACLGPNFDAEMIEKAKKDDDIDDSFLESCVRFGFLRNIPGSKKYTWSHDQIQQDRTIPVNKAAYDLIPPLKRESFHLLLGTRLFISTSSSEMRNMIFFIVDNMNRGSKLIDDNDPKWELAQLNLDAGEKAFSASAFQSAAQYLETGVSLLGPDSWETNYSLTIALYDAASEALFATGNFSRLFEIIEEPLIKARSFEDRLNVYNNLVRSLAASSKFDQALEKCVDILHQLGEVIPTNINAGVYADEVTHVKKVLNGKSPQELLSLPKMSNQQKLAAMQFYNHGLTVSYIAKPHLNPIIVFRMVTMSTEHGITNVSPFAFSCYGAWLVSEPSCDVEGGYEMGRVAIKMMKELGAFEMTPRLYTTVHGFINIWKEPWQASLSKHLEAYESGATLGDMEYAATNLFQYTNTALYGCGEKLASMSQTIQAYAKHAFQCGQRNCWVSLIALHQLALDLMGTKKNAFLAHSNEMTEESFFTQMRNNNAVSICRLICIKRKYVAFFTGDMDNAEKMFHLCRQDFPIGSTGRMVNYIISMFIDGLISLFFARKQRKDKDKWTKIGLDVITSFKTWIKSSDWNFSNKLYLLEAEYCFLTENGERARLCYAASIQAATEHRFIHEEGLAEEKFATHCLHECKHDEAICHFVNAKKCYQAWGAHALVNRVENVIAKLSSLVGRC